MSKTKSQLIDSLDAFTRSYLETALWASAEFDDEGNMLESLAENFGIEDFDSKSLRSAIADCRAFQDANLEDLRTAYLEAHAGDFDAGSCMAGHDLWLTRNHHGAGFWDRGLGDVGQRLTDAAHTYGSVDLQVYRGKVTGH